MVYLVKRHRKWWAMHDIPPKLRPVMGITRLAKSLETDNERTAKKRAGLLWLHDWSRQIDEAKAGAPHVVEDETAFLRRILLNAKTEEERDLIRDRIADEAQERYERALGRAGYIDEEEVPPDVEVPGTADAERFFKLATGQVVPTLDHIDEWLGSLSNEAKTKDMKRSTVTKFAADFPHLQDITRKEVQRWFNRKVTEEGLASKTLTRNLSELRSYWSYLQSLELVPEDGSPFDKLTINGAKSQSYKPFTAEEALRLLDEAKAKGDTSLVDLISLGMWTGGRIESLCSLKLERVVLNEDKPKLDLIRIEDDKTEAGTREVPVHSKLKPILKRLLEASTDGYVLSDLPVNKYGDRSDAIGKRFGRLKADLGFGPQYVFHSFRHTVATLLENAGVPENVAADIVGHEKPRITYGLYSGGASLETKREALERLRY